MSELLNYVSPALLVAVIILLLVLLQRQARINLTSLVLRLDALDKNSERVERAVKEEVARNREESAVQARGLREEVNASLKSLSEAMVRSLSEIAGSQQQHLQTFAEQLARTNEASQASARQLREELAVNLKGFNDSVLKQMADMATLQKNQLESFAVRLTSVSQSNEQKLEAMRVALEQQFQALLRDNGHHLDQIRLNSGAQAKQTRDETIAGLKSFNDSVLKGMGEMTTQQRGQMESFSVQLSKLTESNEKKLDQLKFTVEGKLGQIQQDNAAKLEEMRRTVDEKLQGALERRLGESFKLVSERLELVHKGLGEMQTLAIGVGDLKKVLTNVKTRGTWGEMQLGNLLEQVLTQDQFAANVATKSGSADRVEFAIRLPGRDELEGQVVWLPIDAKFPKEDYERLVEAADQADAVALEEAARQLELRIKAEAKNIRDKYIDPPQTTDFGILFLPTEGLYAEVLRRPGLVEVLQREYRVNVAGPTTLGALLNSLQMGFRTLAIQKRSSEVWAVLGAVKSEFGKFGEVIDRVQKKLQEASNVMDTAATRSRVIERKLRNVQELPAAEASVLLGETAKALSDPEDLLSLSSPDPSPQSPE